MPNHMLIRLRPTLLVAATIAALAVPCAPALAGEDGPDCADASTHGAVAHASGEDCPPPAPQPTAVPPAPVPVQPTPVPAAPVVPTPVKPTPTKKPAAKHKAKKAVAVQAPVVPQRTFVNTEQATVPQGGIQAGAGGTAPQISGGLPVALGLALAGLLMLLAGGSGLRLAQVRSRR
jgi:outer membrane biosynthesis protein TonB